MRFLSILLILALVGVVGCGQEAAENNTEQAAEHVEDAAPADTEAAVASTVSVGDELTLAGTAGCGHCNFQYGEGCAMAMKDANGIVYILDGIDEDTEAFNQRMSGKEITVVGKVTETGEPHHLAVESYEM